MARVSMNELTTYRWSFEEDVLHYRTAGLQAMSVWRHKLSDFGEEKGAELLRDCGLKTASLLWAGGFTGNDGRNFEESVEDARDAIRVAALLDADNLLVYPGARAGHTRSHARRLLKLALAELVPLADALGVTLALEPMHEGCATDWTFLTDLDETLEQLAGFNSPNVKLAFDTYHLGHCPRILQRIAELAPRTAIVQLGDARSAPKGEQNRCRLGEGTLPLREIVRAYEAAGYAGYYDVELMGEDIESSDYHELLRGSLDVVERLVDGLA